MVNPFSFLQLLSNSVLSFPFANKNISQLNGHAVLLGFGQAFERLQQAKLHRNKQKPKPAVVKVKSDAKLKKKFGKFFKRKPAPATIPCGTGMSQKSSIGWYIKFG